MLWLLCLLWACDAPPPETDFAGQPGTLGAPDAAAGSEARAVREENARSSAVIVQRPGRDPVVITDEGNPDRVALSPDGEQVAWVSGASGLASVWTAPTVAGAVPRQLTNVGLEDLPREPGQPPAGWVAPPHDESLRFEGDRLVWDSPQGPQSVEWR